MAVTVKQQLDAITYVYIKALLHVCMKITARGGMSRDKYSTRQSRVLYLSQDTDPPSAIFFRQTSKGGALIDILYFRFAGT